MSGAEWVGVVVPETPPRSGASGFKAMSGRGSNVSMSPKEFQPMSGSAGFCYLGNGQGQGMDPSKGFVGLLGNGESEQVASPSPLLPGAISPVTPPHGIAGRVGLTAVSPLELFGSPERAKGQGVHQGIGSGSPVPTDVCGSAKTTPEKEERGQFPLPVMAQRCSDELGPRPSSSFGPVWREAPERPRQKRLRRSLGLDLNAARDQMEVKGGLGAQERREEDGLEELEGALKVRRNSSIDGLHIAKILSRRAGSFVFGSPSDSESGSAHSGSPSLAWAGRPRSALRRSSRVLSIGGSQNGSWATIAPSENDVMRSYEKSSLRIAPTGDKNAEYYGDRDSLDGGCSYVPDSQPDRDEGNSCSAGRFGGQQALSGLIATSPSRHSLAVDKHFSGLDEDNNRQGEDVDGLVRSSQLSDASPPRLLSTGHWSRRMSTTLDTKPVQQDIRWIGEHPDFGLNDLFTHDDQTLLGKDDPPSEVQTKAPMVSAMCSSAGRMSGSSLLSTEAGQPVEPEMASCAKKSSGRVEEETRASRKYDPGKQPPMSLRPNVRRPRIPGGRANLFADLLSNIRSSNKIEDEFSGRTSSPINLVRQIEVDVMRRCRSSGLRHGSGPSYGKKRKEADGLQGLTWPGGDHHLPHEI